MHLICNAKFCITFVFHFLWVLQPSQEELKTMLMQTFGGPIRYIMGNVEVAYSCLQPRDKQVMLDPVYMEWGTPV